MRRKRAREDSGWKEDVLVKSFVFLVIFSAFVLKAKREKKI
jgi:hypothetical protein